MFDPARSPCTYHTAIERCILVVLDYAPEELIRLYAARLRESFAGSPAKASETNHPVALLKAWPPTSPDGYTAVVVYMYATYTRLRPNKLFNLYILNNEKSTFPVRPFRAITPRWATSAGASKPGDQWD